MHPTGVASAAWVFASAPSKVPFYVAGGLLVAWAVLLAAVGLTHADFPASTAGMRLVMAVSGLLVAATMSMAVVTAGEDSEGQGGAAAGGAGSTGASSELRLAADPQGGLSYDKKRATVNAGKVVIRFVNQSPVPHNVTITKGDQVIARTKTITSGTIAATSQLSPGDYVFFCSVDEHRQGGMQGTLTVR